MTQPNTSTRPRTVPLDYPADPAALFERLRHLPGACWLDSGAPRAQARYDVMTALPGVAVSRRAGVDWLEREDGTREPLRGSLWDTLRTLLGPRRAPEPGVPFPGGLLGCIGYDLGQEMILPGADPRPGDGLPELWLGRFDAVLILDHHARAASLVIQPGGEAAAERIRACLGAAAPEPAAPCRATDLREDLDAAGYAHAFRRVQHYLREGDCYQVNLARAFRCDYRGDPWSAYRELRASAPAPHGAWLGLPEGDAVLSLSPERFLAVGDGGRVETRPIKGTRPRSADPATDRAFAEALRTSPKDRAENVMIVDLLRNDLGRVCATGSVRTESLFAVESFASVHHLVSVVTGQLAAGADALELLRACFPGGSITGAPKRRAMEVIAELEPTRRGLYCGAIGYLGYDGRMDTSITIRTAVCHAGTMTYRAGGGVVVDSVETAELQETRDKARAFLELAGAI